ncbi:MAG: hypothetical protein IPL70_07245 [Uliginosibacterium sp.]|nr:hypothetical protein [Uliginosibacterium sp.]
MLGSEPVGDVIHHAQGMFQELEFFTGSAELLQFIGLKESFDLLVCSEVIEHVPFASRMASSLGSPVLSGPEATSSSLRHARTSTPSGARNAASHRSRLKTGSPKPSSKP